MAAAGSGEGDLDLTLGEGESTENSESDEELVVVAVEGLPQNPSESCASTKFEIEILFLRSTSKTWWFPLVIFFLVKEASSSSFPSGW